MWRFINDDRRLLRKNVRTAPVISMEEFKKKFEKYVDKDFLPEFFVRIDDFIRKRKQADRDMHKVDFDLENCEVEDWITLDNGIPIALVLAGGDWEYPLYFCIYWDGKKSRVYIPRYGNAYNVQDAIAFGNDYYNLYDPTDPYRILIENFLKKETARTGKTEDEVVAEITYPYWKPPKSKNDFISRLSNGCQNEYILYIWKYGKVTPQDYMANAENYDDYTKEAKEAILEDINLAIQVTQ